MRERDVNFITEPYSHSDLRKFKFKKRYSHISANMPINLFWGEICGEKVDEYWSKGTVSYTILNCARLLGCSKIILVGQDLAYIEAYGYKPINLLELNKNLCKMKVIFNTIVGEGDLSDLTFTTKLNAGLSIN